MRRKITLDLPVSKRMISVAKSKTLYGEEVIQSIRLEPVVKNITRGYYVYVLSLIQGPLFYSYQRSEEYHKFGGAGARVETKTVWTEPDEERAKQRFAASVNLCRDINDYVGTKLV